MKGIPGHMPIMPNAPYAMGALAWYHREANAYDLARMHYKARGETVILQYPHPTATHLTGVPRTLVAAGCPDDRDFRVEGEPLPESVSFTSSLRPEQVPFVDDCVELLHTYGGGIGVAPTGFGKTVVGCDLITRMRLRTCIIIPKGDLDWEPSILEHTNIPKEKVSIWRGQTLPDPNAWVVVAMLQSITRMEVYPLEIYRRFGMVIFDEVHRLGTEIFGNAVRQFPARYRFGLSATPERRDGKLDYIRAHVGWGVAVGKSTAAAPKVFTITTDWSEPIMRNGKLCQFDPSRHNVASKSLAADALRNGRIATAAQRAHAKGRRTIIFVRHIKHGDNIKKALLSMGVPASAIFEYNGGSPDAVKKAVKSPPPGAIIIATYAYTAEGTNIPELDVAILAYPIYDPTQAVGRILRQVPGKPQPVVLDVVDASCPTLNRIAYKRRGFLEKIGARYVREFE